MRAGSDAYAKRQARFRTAVCVAASLIVVACGGGGGREDVASAPVIPVATKASCNTAGLQAVAPDGSTVDKVEIIAANATTGIPEYCSVSAHYMSEGLLGEPGRRVNYFVLLPTASWNGKVIISGGGGFSAGGAQRGLLKRGYVTAYTDAGHTSTTGPQIWAINNFTGIVDFGYRAVHQTTLAVKALAPKFYAAKLSQTYYVGCSTGGRQGLVAAARYPTDFNGVLAGAPALDYDGLIMAITWNMQKQLRGPSYFIPASKLPVIQKAVMAACDGLDGVVDGIISRPQQCKFDPKTIQCSGADSATCLTPGQVDTLQAIWKGPTTTAGVNLHPGPFVGSEGAGNWQAWITGTATPTQQADGRYNFPGDPTVETDTTPLDVFYASNYMKYFFFPTADSTRDYRDFNFDRDPQLRFFMGETQDAQPNLTAFNAAGGKLIIYHGLADGVVYPKRTMDYMDAVTANVGSDAETKKFARLFLVPGMTHCGGGPGPDRFGTGADGPVVDPSHDAMEALDQWVTKGAAPDSIIASKVDATTRAVTRTRPLCPYPQNASYTGTGSTDDAANFVCR